MADVKSDSDKLAMVAPTLCSRLVAPAKYLSHPLSLTARRVDVDSEEPHPGLLASGAANHFGDWDSEVAKGEPSSEYRHPSNTLLGIGGKRPPAECRRHVAPARQQASCSNAGWHVTPARHQAACTNAGGTSPQREIRPPARTQDGTSPQCDIRPPARVQTACRPTATSGRRLECRMARRPSATSGHLLECRRHVAPARQQAACSNAGGRRHAAAEQIRAAIASRAAPCHQSPYTAMPSAADSSPPQKLSATNLWGAKAPINQTQTGPCLVKDKKPGPTLPTTNQTCSLYDTTSHALRTVRTAAPLSQRAKLPQSQHECLHACAYPAWVHHRQSQARARNTAPRCQFRATQLVY